MPRKPRQLRRSRVRHIRIDGDLDQIRPKNVAARLEEDGERRKDGLKLVGPQISQQATHQPAVVGLADDIVVLRRLFRRLFLGILRFFLIGHLLLF